MARRFATGSLFSSCFLAIVFIVLSVAVTSAQTTTVSLSSDHGPGNTSVLGEAVAFTATVADTAEPPGTPAGRVTFRDGTVLLGSATLNASGEATFTTALLSVSGHSINAYYEGGGGFPANPTPGTLTHTVNTRPVTMSVGLAPTTVGVGAGGTVTLTVNDAATTGPPGTPGSIAAGLNALPAARTGHTATLLPDGRVLIAGGKDSGGTPLATLVVYNPVDQTFSSVTGNLDAARSGHTATLLSDGKILFVGGNAAPPGQAGRTAELYTFNLSTNTGSTVATGSMATARFGHTATLLANDTVLIAGGESGTGNSTVELYASGTFTAVVPGNLATHRVAHSATLLSANTILFAGGDASGTFEIYTYTPGSPGTGSTSGTTAWATARSGHSATALLDGSVLIVGGDASGAPVGTLEKYDVTGGSFVPIAGTLTPARSDHTATLLNSALVLITGGLDATPATLDAVQRYLPSFDPKGTITLTSDDGSGSPADTFTQAACALVLSGTGTTQCTSSVTPGNVGTNPHVITAPYQADSVHSALTGTADLTVIKGTQATVTVAGPSDATYQQTGLSATASGGSGTGAYSYTAGSSTACSVDAATGALTITSGTGTCSITATRAADENYEVSAISAPLTVTTHRAAQTITILAPTDATYQQTGLSASASGGDGTGAFSYSADGTPLACSVDATTGALTISSGTGTCTVTATKAADSNYDIATATATITIHKATQATITISAPTDAFFDQPGLSVSASGGSGTGAFSYSADGTPLACSVDATTGALTITKGQGECTITATKAADDNYAVATASASVTVHKANQAPLTISAPLSATYGATGQSVSASGGTGSGSISYAVTGSLTACSVDANSGALTLTSGSGTCVVTATKAGGGDYENSLATATIQLLPRPITVTPNAAQSKFYNNGDGDPVLSFTVGGGLAFTDTQASVFTGALQRALGETPGTYAINLGSLAANSNYSISGFTAGVMFTIEPRPITVTPDSGQSKVYNRGADPALMFAVAGNGLAPGEAIASVFSGALHRAAGEDAGTYAIDIGTLTPNANYSVAGFTSGVKFSITPRPVVGQVTIASRQYDGTTNASIASYALGESIAGDNVSLTGGTATFDNKNVGTGKTVAVTGLMLSGTSAANYSTSATLTTTGIITPAPTTTNLSGVSALTRDGKYQITAKVTWQLASESPAGTVTFTDNGTTLQTSALDASGQVAWGPIPVPLAAGQHNIKASYTPDTNLGKNFGASESVMTVTVTGAVSTQPGRVVLQTAAVSNASAVSLVQCRVDSLAPVAPPSTLFPACDVDPKSLPGGASTITVKVQTVSGSTAALRQQQSFYAMWLGMAGIVFLPLAGLSPSRRRRKLPAGLGLTLIVALCLAAVACGGGFSNPKSLLPSVGGPGATQPGQYVVVVSGVDAGLKPVMVATVPVNVQY